MPALIVWPPLADVGQLPRYPDVRDLALADEAEPFFFVLDVVVDLPWTVVLHVDPDVLLVEDHVDLFVTLPDLAGLLLVLVVGEALDGEQVLVLPCFLLILHLFILLLEEVHHFLVGIIASDRVDVGFLFLDLIPDLEIMTLSEAKRVTCANCIDGVTL